MLLDPNEYIDSIVLSEGYYEDEALQALSTALGNDQGVIWDVGGNIGLHSFTLSLKHPSASVYCFEPNPVLAEIISWHASQNSQCTVKHVPLALSDAGDDSILHLYPGNVGMSSLTDWSGSSSTYVSIRAMRADDIIQSGIAPTPNVIKLDVEGHELEVLHGFGGVIHSPVIRCIVFEDSRREDSPVKTFLRGHAFNISTLARRSNISSHDLDNFVAIRS